MRDQSVTRVVSSFPLMHHDPSDLGSVILMQITQKERILRFKKEQHAIYFKAFDNRIYKHKIEYSNDTF